ncbi:MAG TPA: hypothetical protein VG245_03020 [Candidatus Dormibacteraeota bacterium]|jgi:hypothetical protein|nr:hypothetical protein [Candidatus Dormibacteraeota bacterium]
MDDQEDILDKVPKVDPAVPAASAGDPPPDPDAAAPAADAPEAAAELVPVPRLYRLRPPGLRPAPRPARGHRAGKLRSDCPPDARRETQADPRARLR